MVTEYKVIQGTNLSELTRLVNELIASGWSPQGGICESGDEGYIFFQAMVYKIDA